MKKGIEKHVLFEVKKDVNNLRELVNYASETYGNAPAFRYKSEGVIKAKSYNEFAEDVNSLGTTFHSMFGKGKKIALNSENSYEWILAYFATANSENIIVPLDKELS